MNLQNIVWKKKRKTFFVQVLFSKYDEYVLIVIFQLERLSKWLNVKKMHVDEKTTLVEFTVNTEKILETYKRRPIFNVIICGHSRRAWLQLILPSRLVGNGPFKLPFLHLPLQTWKAGIGLLLICILNWPCPAVECTFVQA